MSDSQLGGMNSPGWRRFTTAVIGTTAGLALMIAVLVWLWDMPAGDDTPSRELVFRNAQIPCPESEIHDRPSVDLNLGFGYSPNSLALTKDGARTLRDLANALNSDQLSGSRFLAIGHVEARGDVASEERVTSFMVNSVVDFLVNRGGVDRSSLAWSACGATRLADNLLPSSLHNRRIEIVNIGLRQ